MGGGSFTHGCEYALQVRSQTRLQYRRTRPTRRAAWGSRFYPQVPQRTRVDRDSAGRKCALHIRARQTGSKRRLRCPGVELGFPVYQISIQKQVPSEVFFFLNKNKNKNWGANCEVPPQRKGFFLVEFPLIDYPPCRKQAVLLPSRFVRHTVPYHRMFPVERFAFSNSFRFRLVEKWARYWEVAGEKKKKKSVKILIIQ